MYQPRQDIWCIYTDNLINIVCLELEWIERNEYTYVLCIIIMWELGKWDNKGIKVVENQREREREIDGEMKKMKKGKKKEMI